MMWLFIAKIVFKSISRSRDYSSPQPHNLQTAEELATEYEEQQTGLCGVTSEKPMSSSGLQRIIMLNIIEDTTGVGSKLAGGLFNDK